MRRTRYLIGLCLLLLISCNNKEDEEVLIKGTVFYFGPPDNCNDYIIQVDKNIYKPEQLDPKFQQDSLRVKISYSMTENRHNCGFGGSVPIIKIKKIEKD